MGLGVEIWYFLYQSSTNRFLYFFSNWNVCKLYNFRTNLWYNNYMIPHMNPIIRYNPQLSSELNLMNESNCGAVQLWHHSWIHNFSQQKKKTRGLQLTLLRVTQRHSDLVRVVYCWIRIRIFKTPIKSELKREWGWQGYRKDN